MLKESIQQALNEQLVREAEASFKYLAMAAWCEARALEGAAEFFYTHSDEERLHMMKVLRYVLEIGGNAQVPAVAKPEDKFDSIREICESALANERIVTQAVHDLVDLAKRENDLATEDFLRFFVEEQQEEEVLFQRVLDRIRLIGDGPQSLYFIDQELGKLNNQRPEGEA